MYSDGPLTPKEYEDLALDYFDSLPIGHIMEVRADLAQRKIFLESMDLIHSARPDIQIYNEMLIQYRVGKQLRRVMPDNMVCLSMRRALTQSSYNPELEPSGPFWVLEWVCQSSARDKDYGGAFRKYECDLKVPCCLQFHLEEEEIRFYRHSGRGYRPIPAGQNGRWLLPELEVELGLLDGWVRFWFRGELLPLPRSDAEELARLKAMLAQFKKSPNGQGN